jgi:hypothetical protein
MSGNNFFDSVKRGPAESQVKPSRTITTCFSWPFQMPEPRSLFWTRFESCEARIAARDLNHPGREQ